MSIDAVSPHPISRRFIRLRLPIVLLTLVVIVYFCIAIITQIRLGIVGLSELSDPSNSQEVLEVIPDTSASRLILPGDRLIAVDGWPTQFNVDWHNFYPVKDSFVLTLRRSEEVLTVTVLTTPPALEDLASRIILPTVSVLTWLVGALILLLATPRNYEAWHVGFIVLSMALVLVGMAALVYEIPGGQMISGGLMTIAAVGFAELALFPSGGVISRPVRRFFRAAYAGALFVSAINLFDMFILRPTGIRLYDLTGIVPLRLALFYAAIFLIMNPALTVVRYVRLPHSYLKRQLRILMLGALAAFGPLVFLVIVPSLFMPDGKALVPYQIAFLLITLMPATLGYVIYRHKYLGLDVLVTHTMSLLIIGLFVLFFYSLFYAGLRQVPGLFALEPLPSSVFVLGTILVMPASSKSSLRLSQRLLYGRPLADQRVLRWATATLSANPEMSILREVIREISQLLQVHQAGLLVIERSRGDFVPVEALHTHIECIPATEAQLVIPPSLVTRTGLEPGEIKHHPLLTQYVWAELLAPIVIGETMTGVLILGQRIPDGAFDAYQIGFIHDACNALAVTIQTIMLFEGALTMSRTQMKVRELERAEISTLIHDEALQAVSASLMHLDRMANQTPSLAPSITTDLHDALSALRDVPKILRDICFDLRPPILQDRNMEWLVKDRIYKFNADTSTPLEFHLDVPDGIELSEPVTTSVYHVLTEALHNIKQHASASAVWITVKHADGHFSLSVEDNGRGLDTQNLSLAELVRAHHFGIVGMFEWARLINGTLAISARRGGGTTVTLTYEADS